MAHRLLDVIFGRPSIVAVDIGSTSVKLMECQAEGGRIIATRLGMAPTPPGALANGVVVDPVVVGDTIRDLLQSTGSRATLGACAVTDPSLVATRLQVPRRDPVTLAKAIPFEARPHIPFGLEEGQLAWQVLDPDSTQPQMCVLVVAARSETVESRVQALEIAGLAPVVMEPVQFAVLRTEIYANADPHVFEETLLLLHIGAAFTEITIVWHGCFAFPRIIPVAGQSMDQAIMSTFSVDAEEARRIKESRAVACTREEAEALPEEQRQVSRAISPVLEEIVRDTKTSLNFLVSSFQTAGRGGANRVLVSGGVSRLPRLEEYLHNALGTRVIVSDVFGNARITAPSYDPGFTADLSPYFAVAAGLALREPMLIGAYQPWPADLLTLEPRLSGGCPGAQRQPHRGARAGPTGRGDRRTSGLLPGGRRLHRGHGQLHLAAKQAARPEGWYRRCASRRLQARTAEE
jgi:type IV pilus assembly protein PilM